MTSEQATRIASRAIAAYLLFWALDDVIALPRQLLYIVHEYHGPGVMGFSALSAFNASFYARSSVLSIAENILHIALWLAAARWFYRCGPGIQHFFQSEDTPTAD